MIIENYITVEGYTDSHEDFEKYINSIVKKPAQIYSYSISLSEDAYALGKFNFKIKYIPLDVTRVTMYGDK